jgi:hypothetical protein
MNKEDLIQFLKDNLTIDIRATPEREYYHGVVGANLVLTLKICDDVIDTSETSIDF